MNDPIDKQCDPDLEDGYYTFFPSHPEDGEWCAVGAEMPAAYDFAKGTKHTRMSEHRARLRLARHLVTKWRDSATRYTSIGDHGRAKQLTICADMLEKVLE